MYPWSRKEVQLNIMVHFELSLSSVLAIKLKNTKQVKKGWKLDMDNILEEYRNTINLQGRNSEEIRKALKETFKEVADKTIQKKEK